MLPLSGTAAILHSMVLHDLVRCYSKVSLHTWAHLHLGWLPIGPGSQHWNENYWVWVATGTLRLRGSQNSWARWSYLLCWLVLGHHWCPIIICWPFSGWGNLDIVDNLVQIMLVVGAALAACCGGCPVHCMSFKHVWPLLTRCCGAFQLCQSKLSLDIAKCPLKGKNQPTGNHCVNKLENEIVIEWLLAILRRNWTQCDTEQTQMSWLAARRPWNILVRKPTWRHHDCFFLLVEWPVHGMFAKCDTFSSNEWPMMDPAQGCTLCQCSKRLPDLDPGQKQFTTSP